jgi:thiamine pyrophosphokinase
MSRGILLIGGYGPGPEKLKQIISPGDLVCAADSGLDAAISSGIEPDGIVGDMDSLSDKSLLRGFAEENLEIYPVDKDETDTELGISWLRKRGCSSLIIIGGGEGRLDHTLALKALFGIQQPPDAWYTAREKIWSLTGRNRIQGQPGSTVSFVTSGKGPWRVSSRGLQWELDRVVWDVESISLSNRIKGSSAEIIIDEGRLLVIQPYHRSGDERDC